MQKETLKKIGTYLVLLISLLLIIGYFFFLRPSIRFSEERPTLERGFTYSSFDFVEAVNGQIVSDPGDLDTEDVGSHSYHFRVRNWLIERDVVFEYDVADTRPPEIEIRERNVVVEIEDGYDEEDIRKNVIINEGDLVCETDYDKEFPGIYTVNVRAFDDYGNESSDSFNVIVRDSQAPMILKGGYGAVIRKGEKFDIHDFISYGDNADPNVKLNVEGTVNTSKIGTYPLHIELRDGSGNETEWDIDVKVVSKYPKEEEEEEPDYKFEDFLKEYKKEGRKFGIDVSTWQGEIDYEKVKKAGCEFVIIRIGYSHGGVFKVDDQFERNITKAKEAGLMTGVYLFSYDRNEEELLSALEQVFGLLEGKEVDLPIVFDWEDFFDFQDYQMSFRDLNHLYDVFVQTVEQKGYEAMMYGSKYYLDHIFAHKDTRKVWLAQYSDWPSYEYPYVIWQVSDHGKIDGIDGFVDLNILFTESE